MNRFREINARLMPWTSIPDDQEDFVAQMTPAQWQRLLGDAAKLTGLTRFWFRAGLHRAITEMQRTDADGRPLFRTRTELIEHLKTIDNP